MSHLDDLISSTRRRVEELKGAITPEALEQRVVAVESPRSFATALEGDGIAVIAEMKRASPAAGELNPDLNPRAIAESFARGGAAAISVLTEPHFFHGSLDDLAAAREAGLPVLRKDFILDPIQVLESRAWGADAVLLIVRAVGDRLSQLHRAVTALGMDALVEVHDDADLDRALEVDAEIIGINHRDLATFDVDPQRTAALAPRISNGRIVIALSGISDSAGVRAAAAAGASAVLVGEAIVTASDPAAAIAELIGRG
jgi:indole-3-glycerol phosphate synthase